MKRILSVILTVCLLTLMGGCSKKEEKKEEKAAAAVQVAYSTYRYEGGYQPAEGWMYDMTISEQGQLKTLKGLTDGLKLMIHDEMFELGRGYHLTFTAADGSVERELLILEDGTVSREGMMYEAEGADTLLTWLDALRIEEQDVE